MSHNQTATGARKASAKRSVGQRLLIVGMATVISLLLNATVPFVLNKTSSPVTSGWVVFGLLVFMFLAIPVAVSASVIASIAVPFGRVISWQPRVYLVIAGYLAMVITYSGIYFSIASLGDYNQALASNTTFHYASNYRDIDWAKKSREELLATRKDQLQFKGMNYSVFLAIHEDALNDHSRQRASGSAEWIISMAQSGAERRPRLDSGAMPGLFGDCFHFSVATAATVGYGDIVPASSFSRVISDTEILASVGILIFGLGFVMSGRPKDNNDKESKPNIPPQRPGDRLHDPR